MTPRRRRSSAHKKDYKADELTVRYVHQEVVLGYQSAQARVLGLLDFVITNNRQELSGITLHSSLRVSGFVTSTNLPDIYIQPSGCGSTALEGKQKRPPKESSENGASQHQQP